MVGGIFLIGIGLEIFIKKFFLISNVRTLEACDGNGSV